MYGSRFETAMNFNSPNRPSSSSCSPSLVQTLLGCSEIGVTRRLFRIDTHQFVEHQPQRLVHRIEVTVEQKLPFRPSKAQPPRAKSRPRGAREHPTVDIE